MIKKAIIDIGTNTFNLLVVEVDSKGKINMLIEKKYPVKLGKGSMNDGILKNDAIERALEALKKQKATAIEYEVDEIKAFATSAVRNAKNKSVFLQKVKNETDLDIVVISGDCEAELIYNGVKNAVPLKSDKNYLILDIGGGSNEFILCNNTQILWKKSYDLGMARMLEYIDPSDPVSSENIKKLIKYSDTLTEDLMQQCEFHKPDVLIGASGSFETYVSMILHKKYGNNNAMSGMKSFEIQLDDFKDLHTLLLQSTSEERAKLPGLPLWRIEMIVLAIVFTRYVVEKYNLKQIFFSDYALKEGVIFEGN